jgi:MFS family permease
VTLTSSHGGTAPPTSVRPTAVLAVLLAAGISFALSQTIVLPALSVLGQEYGAGATATSWIVTAYLLSASISTPIVGKLGDVHGKGRVLTVVLALFALGGTVNALAGSIELVIAGRVLQGVAAGVFPLSFGIIRDTFPPERVPGADQPHQLGVRRRRRASGCRCPA